MAVGAHEDQVSGDRRRHGLTGYAVLVVGAVILLAAAAMAVSALRGPSLTPTSYGNGVVGPQEGLYGVTIFTTGGLAHPPQCFIDGLPAMTRGPEAVSTRGPQAAGSVDGLEATYGLGGNFPTTEKSYTLTCGSVGEQGEFAAVQYVPKVERVVPAGVIGVPGLLILAVGLTLVISSRRRKVDQKDTAPPAGT